MLHLSRGMLLLPWLLLLLTSCADSIIEPCGGNASFVWDYEVPAFIAVEWYFENTQIAITLGEELSQDTIKINDVYKSRFVLLEKDKTGFTLINVTGTDEGNYTCTLTLQSTDIPKELKKTLNVTVSGCQRRKRDTDAGEQQCYCKEDEDEDEDKRPPGSGEEEEQPPVSRAPGHDVLAAICVPVAVITAVIAVIFAVVVVKRKRSPEAMERTKRYGPVELKDKNESPDQQQ